jgi:uncharacterized protein YigA (DUF484 family)
MTVQEKRGGETRVVSDSEVSDYLIKHPDFFDKNPDVLKQVEVPHKAGAAVSLIERQVGVLRQENRNLRSKIRDLVDIAKENDALMARMNRLSAELVSSEDLNTAIKVLTNRLTHDFSAQGVAIRLIGDFGKEKGGSRAELVKEDVNDLALFESILTRGKPVCGKFNIQQLDFMFGEKEEQMKSVAVIPLGDGSLGFLAIGSEDPERFRAGISTSFLSYLGEITGAVVKRFR